MSLSRWKMMAGVLGVSLGGLAAAASQCPKMDNTKGGRTEEAVAKAEPPALPPVEFVPPAPATPPMPTAGAPAGPQLLPGATSPPAVPPATGGALPALPEFPAATPEPKPAKPMDVTPTGGTTLLPALPTGGTTTSEPKPPMPEVPKGPAPDVPPSKPIALPTSFAPGSVELPGKPNTPPAPMGVELHAPGKPVPPSTGPALPPPPLPMTGPAPSAPPMADPLLDVPPGKPPVTPGVDTPGSPKAAATKFRILLRVGEGEPTFEVMHGDNLVLKVACEKVDIKSPEKGQGLSAVTARGKVRFAGFGAEGTCDELSFLAGTGEVSMAGRVNVRVKDKLGRTESELSGESVKYKLDASAVAGTLKP